MGSVAAAAVGRLVGFLPRSARAQAGDQLMVASGQMAAGIGNLAFLVIAARILAPSEFALLASFLALFLLVQLFAESISSGSALVPELAVAARVRVGLGGLALGAVVAVAALPLSSALGLPVELVLIFAAVCPVAALLALARGGLYGRRRHRSLMVSLVSEPAVRLSFGVALAVQEGPVGAAVGILMGALVALAVSRPFDVVPRSAAGAAPTRWPGSMLASFVLLAAVQTQAVAVANGLLDAEEAARFAAAATLGGIAAYATATIPLVLLPSAARGDRAATPIAVGAAIGIGATAVLVTLAAPGLLIDVVLGERYASAAPLAAPYMMAMALLGVVRVLVAHLSATGGGATVLRLVGLAVVVQLSLLAWLGDTASGFVAATLVSVALLTVTLGAQALAPPRLPDAAALRAMLRTTAAVVAGITLVGVAVRLFIVRGLWVDEAISVAQANMGLGAMLDEIRATDVHPPLHHVVLWGTVRVIGDGELAVRIPSLIAGALLVPMLFVLGRELYGRRTALIAAGLGAVSPLLVWYSQEARMYGILTLLSLVNVWALVRALRTGDTRYWALLGVSCALTAWTHYLALIQIAVLALVAVAGLAAGRRDRTRTARQARGMAIAAVIVVAALVPLAPYAADQFRANEIAVEEGAAQLRAAPAQAGAGVSDSETAPSIYSLITNFAWALWGYHSDAVMLGVGALWPLAILFVLAMLGRGGLRDSAVPVVVVAGTAGLLFLVGLIQPSLFEIRYMIGVVPLLVLLAARAVDRLGDGRRVVTASAAAVLAVTMLVGLGDQQLNRDNPRIFDFAGPLREVSRTAVPGDVLVYQPAWMEDVVAYYAPRVPAEPLRSADLPAADGRGAVFLVFADIGPRAQRLDTAARVQEAREDLVRERSLVRTGGGAQVHTWEYR